MTYAQEALADNMAARIVSRINALAQISERPDALTRICYTPEHARAADLLLGWMREAGMTARLDEVGNVVGRYEGASPDLPCVMIGSHFDTVRDAGKWDGPLGVITAIECIARIAEMGERLPFALEAVGFADEEGVRFSSTLLGSRAIAGTFDEAVLEAVDAGGKALEQAMRGFGLDPALIACAARRPEDVLAYIEVHIEQGPVLEAEGLAVGVVTAISGASRFTVTMAGHAGHAGTVPMYLRRDALAGAAECVLAIERIAAAREGVVGTVGQIAAEPGATNTIPGRARFTIDLRAGDDATRAKAVLEVTAAIEEIAARRKLIVRIAKMHDNKTATCAPWLRAQLAAAIEAAGLPVRELASGAGHDGMAMIDLTDIAMLFVRCKGGISHNPAEHTATMDVAAAAAVLLQTLRNFRPKGA